jgi:hypothetical protein
MTYEIIGQLVQALGIGIVLASQGVFVYYARKKYGSLGTAFLEIQAMRVYMNDDEVKETAKDKQKLKKALKKFPHAKLLYDDFRYSIIGLITTLVGLIVSML